MRFNHMELTFPVGTLTDEFRNELDAFTERSLAGAPRIRRWWGSGATFCSRILSSSFSWRRATSRCPRRGTTTWDCFRTVARK